MGMLATTLRWDAGDSPLQDLQESLLNSLPGDVAGDRRVLRLAGDLVDLVDVDDPLLGPLDVVVGGLEQLEQDVLDILTHIPGFGEGGRIGDSEWDVQLAGECLGEQRLAGPGGADQEDVRLLELDVISTEFGVPNPLVVVVDGDGE